MTPVDTYTAQATVGDVNKGLTNHKVLAFLSSTCNNTESLDVLQNLESSSESLLVFGNGDGGGGPLPKMLENVRHRSLLVYKLLIIRINVSFVASGQ